MPPALHPSFSHLWRSLPALNTTSTIFGCLLFLIFQASSFLTHPFLTQSVRLPLVTYPSLCSTCVTCGTLFDVIGHQMLPTQPLPRGAEDFPRNGKYFKHVPLLTYLIYFSPKGLYIVGPIYVLWSSHRTLINLSLVLKKHFKSPMCW